MDTDHWASYYRSGALVSCPTNPEPCYTMEVREAWARFFSELANDDRILDLGTGNGPIALIASETAREYGRHYEIDGIDLADIDPHKNVTDGENLLAGIRFHAGVSAEELPFKSEQFDAICGQYIVEYTDRKQTLAECARVLVPGGRCQFILHHLDSIIVRNALESLRQAGIVDRSMAIDKFSAYCEVAKNGFAQADAARTAVYDVGKTLQSKAKASSNPLLLRFVIDTISGLLAKRGQLSEGELHRATDSLEQELRRWVQRLKDLVSAALSDEEITSLGEIAESNGFFAVETGEQFQGGDKLVGWRLTMVRTR